jgi:hypothetical protein
MIMKLMIRDTTNKDYNKTVIFNIVKYSIQ